MSDHPLYLERVTLIDGRTGTIVEVHGDGEAFMLELSGAACLDDLITVYPDDLTGAAGLIARHEPNLRKIERGEGYSLDPATFSDKEFDTFVVMTRKERHDRYGDFHSVNVTNLSDERLRAFMWSCAE